MVPIDKIGLLGFVKTKTREENVLAAYNKMFFGLGRSIKNMHHPRRRI